MAYKGKHILAQCTLDFNEQLVDFLVNDCGWTHDTYSPTATQALRDAQEDSDAFILGWFLRSTGEDGKKDIPIHIGWQTQLSTTRGYKGTTTYLTNNPLSDVATTVNVKSAASFTAGDVVQIENELIKTVGKGATSLTGCIRGYWNTTAVAHDQNCVVARISKSAPSVTVYGYRDLNTAHPILSSDATVLVPDWNFTDSGIDGGAQPIKMTESFSTTRDVFVDPVAGLDALAGAKVTGKIDYSCLVQLADGRMRWVTSQTCPSADHISITFDELLAAPAPANVHCSFFSAGWFPSVSRRMPQKIASLSQLHSPGIYGGDSTGGTYLSKMLDVPRDCWLYGSKDGFAAVVKWRSESYGIFTWGSYVPCADPSTSVTTTTTNKGATSIIVADPTIFKVGGRYIIFSQNYQDWANNRDQVANTYMGCPAGGGVNSWENLDGDETAFEYVTVSNVNEGTHTLTVGATCYSYVAGAVMGEDPRPYFGFAQAHGTVNPTSSVSTAYTQFNVASSIMEGATIGRIFHWVRASKTAVIPAHRIRWRCMTTTTGFGIATTAWAPSFQNNDYAFELARYQTYSAMWDISRGVLFPYHMTGVNDAETHYLCGCDQSAYFGYIPIAYYPIISDTAGTTHNPWVAAISEDTVNILWAGNLQTFRLFKQNASPSGLGNIYLALGPEIA